MASCKTDFLCTLTYHDWSVKRVIVDLPIRMKRNSKRVSGKSLHPLGFAEVTKWGYLWIMSATQNKWTVNNKKSKIWSPGANWPLPFAVNKIKLSNFTGKNMVMAFAEHHRNISIENFQARFLHTCIFLQLCDQRLKLAFQPFCFFTFFTSRYCLSSQCFAVLSQGLNITPLRFYNLLHVRYSLQKWGVRILQAWSKISFSVQLFFEL